MKFSLDFFLYGLVITLVSFSLSRQNILDVSFFYNVGHIFTLVCVLSFLTFSIFNSVNKWFITLLFILLLYSVLLVIKNDLPIINILQTLITIKFLFVYFVVAYGIKSNKPDLLIKFIIFLTIVAVISFAFVLTDYAFPNFIYDLAKDGRGIFGVTPGSIFGSRVLYSGFLLFYSVVLLSIRFDPLNNKYLIFKPYQYWTLLLLSLLFLFLTFSRKELVLLLAVYGIYSVYITKGKVRLAIYSLLVIIAPLVIASVWYVIGDSVVANFNENYVRYKIFISAAEIIEYYFPFGSGPGTYGTLLSKYYTQVYHFFDVDKAIIGYGDTISGPIFDLFFVSLAAEYGLAFILLLIFILLPFFSRKEHSVNKVIDISLLRFFLLLMIFGIGFMVPIMGNIVGLLIFFMLGIATSSEDLYLVKVKK